MKLSTLMPALIDDACEAIKQSMSTFVENPDLINCENLSREMVSAFTEGLQEALQNGGKAALKRLIESGECGDDSITRRGSGPASGSANPDRYVFKTYSTKRFLTVFGELEIDRRLYYHWRGGPAVVPLDEAWGMQGRYATPEVTEAILFSTSLLTAREVSQVLAKTSPFKPSASLIQDIVREDGAAIAEMMEQPEREREARPVELPDEPVKALVVSMDGANVMVREPGVKRGRPAQRPGKANGDNSCSYKNAMVGSISFYGEAENVIDFETGKQSLVPHRMQSVYQGRMPEPKAPAFKAQLERSIQEMEEPLPETAERILLMDGARNLWNYVEHNPLYEEYIKVVDYFHAAEHLSLLSEALFGESTVEGQRWFKKWCGKIKREEGGVRAMLRSARRYQKQKKRTKAVGDMIETQMTYFERNQAKMGYAELVSRGLPIGSGPVEAACKMIVKGRFCQSGMRWSIDGGQQVMNLRVIQKSGQWESLWKTYLEGGGYHEFKKRDITPIATRAA